MPEDSKVNPFRLLFGLFAVTYSIYLMVFEMNGTKSLREGLAYLFLGVLIYSIYIYITIRYDNIFGLVKRNINVILLSTVIIGALLIMSALLPVYQLWIAGCVIIAIIYGIYPGMASFITYTLIYGICNELSVVGIIYIVLSGSVLIALTTYYPRGTDNKHILLAYVYSVIIAISCHVSIYMIINKLDIHRLFCLEVYITVLYTFLIVTAVYAYLYYVEEVVAAAEEAEDYTVEEAEDYTAEEAEDYTAEEAEDYTAAEVEADTAAEVEVINDEVEAEPETETEESLDNDNELLDMLKELLPDVYKHSLILAKLSGLAAEAVGADADRAALGAMYHEIGKLSGNEDYVKDGVVLAREYNLSDYIINVIESHRLTPLVPETKEAAIVYLSLIIINSVRRMRTIRDNNDSMTIESLVDNIFRIRLRDGSLDASGLTIYEYNKLKEFYVNYFSEKS